MRVMPLILLLICIWMGEAHAARSSLCAGLLYDTKEQIIQKFQDLNPELSRREILEKIKDSKNPFKLYRSFVSSYYDFIKSDESQMKRLSSVLKAKGWMFGDAHPENFGVILIKGGGAEFTINDIDDGGMGPVALDFLRFATSMRLAELDVEFGDIFKAYKNGLEGSGKPRSKTVKDLLDEADIWGKMPDDGHYDDGEKGIKRDDSTLEVSDTMKDRLESVIKNKLDQKFVLKDAVEVVRTSGGSGGLKRYLVLAKVKKDKGVDGKRVILELKEITNPAILAFPGTSAPAPLERARLGVLHSQGENSSRYYTSLNFAGKPYELRPLFDGADKKGLDEIDSDDLKNYLMLEAWTLGTLHAQTVKSVKAYAASLDSLSATDWSTETLLISERFKEMFKTLKGK